MAELFRHTDEDGDTLVLESESEGWCTANIFNPGDGYARTCVYLDRDAALRLSDALLNHYGLKDITEEEAS
jgi:hypothetical protein